MTIASSREQDVTLPQVKPPWLVTHRPVLLDLAGVAATVVAVLLFFLPFAWSGTIVFDSDTSLFYWPVLSYIADKVRAGSLPLWSPNFMGGFPLFAEANGGSLNPINLLVSYLFPFASSFMWLMAVYYSISGIFTYLFCRTVGIGRLGALVGALTFALGGFSAPHLNHLTFMASAVWLPAVFFTLEKAFRSSGSWRQLWLSAAAVAFALQWLGLHPQMPVITFFGAGVYAVFRVLAGPVAPWLSPSGSRKGSSQEARTLLLVVRTRLRHVITGVSRTALLVWAVGLIVAFGLGLAAVQLLPLLELSTFSSRASGVSYVFAATYRVHPYALLTVLFPNFFTNADGVFWGYWARGETTTYLGAMPLVLACIAVLFTRSRYTLFFFLFAALSVILAMASYSPINVHRLLYELPGFGQLRAPARFLLLFVWSGAILAGIGAHYLAGRVEQTVLPMRGRSWRRFLPAEGALGAALIGGLLFALVLPLLLLAFRGFLLSDKAVSLDLVERFYRTQPNSGEMPDLEVVFDSLITSVDPLHPQTLVSALLLIFALVLVITWARCPGRRLYWQGLVVLVVFAELAYYGYNFYPKKSADYFTNLGEVASFLKEDNDNRVYTWKESRLEPNRTLPLGIQEANGYDPLQPQRHAEYAARAQLAYNRLFDIWNVRYVVTNTKDRDLRNFRGVPYQRNQPMLSLSPTNPTGGMGFYAVPDVTATHVRVISALFGGESIRQGELVADVTAVDENGREQHVLMRAGIDASEWDYESLTEPWHERASVSDTWLAAGESGELGKKYLYYTELPLELYVGETANVTKVRLRYLHPDGSLQVFGLGLVDALNGSDYPLDRFSQDKFRLSLSEGELRVYENATYLPRTFLVPMAGVRDPNILILDEMAAPGFDPTKLVLLEEHFDTSKLGSTERGDKADIGTAQIVSYDDQRIVIEAKANRNAFLFLSENYYPGWRAFVDGQEVKVYRANYLFRAVLLPEGEHQIEFAYDPASFRAGLQISLAVGSFLVGIWLFYAGIRLVFLTKA